MIAGYNILGTVIGAFGRRSPIPRDVEVGHRASRHRHHITGMHVVHPGRATLNDERISPSAANQGGHPAIGHQNVGAGACLQRVARRSSRATRQRRRRAANIGDRPSSGAVNGFARQVDRMTVRENDRGTVIQAIDIGPIVDRCGRQLRPRSNRQRIALLQIMQHGSPAEKMKSISAT